MNTPQNSPTTQSPIAVTAAAIEAALRAQLNPSRLEVIDESHLHEGCAEHLAATRILQDQQLLGRRDTEQTPRTERHQHDGKVRDMCPEENPEQRQGGRGQPATRARNKRG